MTFRIALAIAFALIAAPASAAPHAGDPAPPFSIARVGGGTLDLRRFHGKPVYVNFFASWCPPCNAEAPDVARLYRTYRARGLVIVGIDYDEDLGSAATFARRYAWPFAVGADPNGSTGQAYLTIGLPVHVFVDKNGKVSTYRDGIMESAEIENAIKKIL